MSEVTTQECDKAITMWNDAVRDFCKKRNITDMSLGNLKKQDLFDYDLFVAHKNVNFAIEMYKKTPESVVYRNGVISAITQWFVQTQDKNKSLVRGVAQVIPPRIFMKFKLRNK